jgi:hypothetical protein
VLLESGGGTTKESTIGPGDGASVTVGLNTRSQSVINL